jgi:hypothetical protein
MSQTSIETKLNEARTLAAFTANPVPSEATSQPWAGPHRTFAAPEDISLTLLQPCTFAL